MEPKIRFKGFCGEWVKKPFSEIANRNSASASSLNYPGVEFEDINSGEGTLNKDVNRKKTVKIGKQFAEGDILFGKLRPYLKNILLADFKGVAIGDFWVLRPQKVTSELLYILVNSREFMRIANISSGSKMPRADWNLVSSTPFAYPNNKEEQNAIGVYFQYLESLIQSTTKKIESLKQVKAASLQSMFPQEGETMPRVRFKGFEEEWKTILVGKLGVWTKGRLLSKSDIIIEGKTPCIHYGELFVIYGEVIEDVISKTNIDNGCYSNRGDILFPDSDVTPTGLARCSAIMLDDVLLGGGINILKVDENYYSPFISYSINQEKGQIISRVTGTTVRHINSSALSEVLIKIPVDIKEQKKLGDYFSAIDSQITLQTQRLEKLKQIKSACLDNMFV